MRPLVYQEMPRCFACGQRVEQGDLVFAAVCGHETCASTCWHYHHLMQAREAWEANASREEHGAEKALALFIITMRSERDGGGDNCP